MQQPDELTPERRTLLKRLGVIADYQWSYRVRLAAVKAVQATLREMNPLRSRSPEELLEEIKPHWATKQVVVSGRAVDRSVQRPPQSLADLW